MIRGGIEGHFRDTDSAFPKTPQKLTYIIKKKPRFMSEAAVVGELNAKPKEDTKTKDYR